MAELFFTMLVPFTIAGVALYGAARRVDVYSALVHGAGEGLGTLVRIVPALIGLMAARSTCCVPRERWNWLQNGWRRCWSGPVCLLSCCLSCWCAR